MPGPVFAGSVPVIEKGINPEPDAKEESWSLWLEFWPSVVAALAMVLTAYCAYQATGWNGVQESELAGAGILRSKAVKATTVGAAQMQYDATTFSAIAVEFRNYDFGDPAVLAQARSLIDRLFRVEAKPAVEEWLSLDPFVDPDAPRSPFEIPGYTNARMDEADRLMAQAEETYQRAEKAGSQGDDYVLATVLFAAVLFFTGLKVRGYWGRVTISVLSTIFLLAGVAWLITLPRV